MPHFVQKIIVHFRRLITSPVGELTRAQRTGKFAIELGMHCARALKHDRASEMAAALTYRTIFSLIPMFVMVLLVFRGFGGFDSVRTDLESKIYDYFGLTNIAQATAPQPDPEDQSDAKDDGNDTLKSVEPDKDGGAKDANSKDGNDNTSPTSPPKDDAKDGGQSTPPGTDDGELNGATKEGGEKQANAPPGEGDDTAASNQSGEGNESSKEKRQRAEGLISFMKDVYEKASNIDAKSIGAFGLILFIWAALALAVELERCFNRVFNCHVGRAWHHRIPIYWAVMTLGPVLIWMSLSVAGKLITSIEEISLLSWIARLGSNLAALGASWLLLFLLFKLMPNTQVKARPALIGALVAAILWELAKRGFGLYVSRAVSFSAIYGTLGLFPLFLLWLYLSWLIVLFGLEITYTLQAMKGRKFKYNTGTQQNPMIDPQWVLPISAQIARSFEVGESLNSRGIAEQLNLPIKAVSHLVSELEKAGIVNRLSFDGEGEAPVALSRPTDKIALEDLLQLSSTLCVSTDRNRRRPEWMLLREFSQADMDAVKGQTVADVIARPSAPDDADDEAASSNDESDGGESDSDSGG